MPYRLTARAMELGEGSDRDINEAWDESLRRAMAHRNYYGPGHETIASALVAEAQAEAAKYPELMPRRSLGGPSAMAAGDNSVLLTDGPGKAWVNLGPTDAKLQFNGTEYLQVDSGRTTGIEVHPTNRNIAYTATSGGGIWKTFNFEEKFPTWYPITESIGQLAIGAMTMDPNNPEVLYAGLGDAFDTASGHMIKTTDGGLTWSSALRLTGSYPTFPDGTVGRAVAANSIRNIAVDPNNSNIVLVATDVGLFRSMDAGISYTLIDLPNAELTGNPGQRAEAIWTIVYTGKTAGVSHWALSGVMPLTNRVGTTTTAAAPPGSRTSGIGDIWTSSDAGATWSSRLAADTLPAKNAFRIDLAASTPGADPTKTILLAQVAASNRTGALGMWRSMDSGATFTALATDATVLRNPTLGTNCRSPLNANGQTFYNQIVAIDPKNSNRAIIGGTLCAIRTLNLADEKPLFDLVSHWLPSGGGGDMAAGGRLPYAHADHHELKIYYVPDGWGGEVAVTVLGTDGGLFVSRNVLTATTVTDRSVTWSFPNRGLVSHLFYNVTSGDVANGSASIVYGGLQDNGTRMRESSDAPTTFNQIIGGDGFGVAVAEVPGNRVLWGSVYYTDLRFCDPDSRDCSRGENWSFRSTPWTEYPSLICPGDNTNGHFYSRIQPIRTATAATGPAILTLTDLGAWRYKGDPFTAMGNAWELLGNPNVTDGTGACLPPPPPPPLPASYTRNLGVSAVHDGLIGVALPGGVFRVTSNCQTDKPGSQCTWTNSNPTGLDLDGSGSITDDEKVSSTSSIDFPPGPLAAGKNLGDVYAVASVAAITIAGTPVPDALNHVFLTEDRGQTWRSLAGTGLPNVPVEVLRYDPSDLTNQTLYVGTSIGVYRTTDGGQTWSRFGAGLPMVSVKDLFVSKTGAFVRAATFGRGLWEIYPSASAEKGVNGNGDADRNLQIDFQDVLATASRLGSSPATTVAPYYDWNQDLIGSVNGIDDADLSSVLVRFGDRP